MLKVKRIYNYVGKKLVRKDRKIYSIQYFILISTVEGK